MMDNLFRHKKLLKMSATIMILRRSREARSSAEFGDKQLNDVPKLSIQSYRADGPVIPSDREESLRPRPSQPLTRASADLTFPAQAPLGPMTLSVIQPCQGFLPLV